MYYNSACEQCVTPAFDSFMFPLPVTFIYDPCLKTYYVVAIFGPVYDTLTAVPAHDHQLQSHCIFFYNPPTPLAVGI